MRRRLEQYRKEMEKFQAELRKAIQQTRQFGGVPGGFGGPGFPFGAQALLRLGASVSMPSQALAEQLDLPKGQGMVIENVLPDSAAAKAGLKAHDILLELNGKPVPNDAREFAKIVADVKADTPVDAVVLRKGKKQTIKGLSMPEAKPAPFPGGGQFPPFGIPPIPPGLGVLGGKGVVATSVTRKDDQFTAVHHEGTVQITVTGKVTDGKAKANEIKIQDGAESNTYQSVDKVPEKYRDMVKSLVTASEKGGQLHIEMKKP